jgi:hypothetical protein
MLTPKQIGVFLLERKVLVAALLMGLLAGCGESTNSSLLRLLGM